MLYEKLFVNLLSVIYGNNFYYIELGLQYMGIDKNVEWDTQKRFEYTFERSHILLQLRYQLAIGIMALIIGVWTVLFSANQLKINYDLLIVIGWIISIFLLVCWRYFTHTIFKEELALNVSRLSCANKLEIQLDKYDEYVDFEKKFKLKEDGDYNSLDTIKKLEVMKKLQYNYPESGIRNFDNISITAIIISGFGFPILYYFIDQSQCVAIPFDYIVIIDAVVTIAASVIICHIINEAGPNEERTKEAIKNVKDEIEREKCS